MKMAPDGRFFKRLDILPKEARFVITAWTGHFLLREEEIEEFLKYMSDITGMKIEHYLDLLNPTVWDLSRSGAHNDFLRLFLTEEEVRAPYVSGEGKSRVELEESVSEIIRSTSDGIEKDQDV